MQQKWDQGVCGVWKVTESFMEDVVPGGPTKRHWGICGEMAEPGLEQGKYEVSLGARVSGLFISHLQQNIGLAKKFVPVFPT